MNPEKPKNYSAPPNRAQVTEREIIAWDMRCKGATLQRIADRLGVTCEGARKIVARVEERESRRLAKNVHRVKARQNGQLEHIIEETLTAWRRSKKPRRRAVRKEGTDRETVEHTEAVDQYGDVVYLHTAMRAQEAQRELNGLNIAPAENTGWTMAELMGDWARLDEEQAEEMKKWSPEERAAHYRREAERREAEAREAREAEAIAMLEIAPRPEPQPEQPCEPERADPSP